MKRMELGMNDYSSYPKMKTDHLQRRPQINDYPNYPKMKMDHPRTKMHRGMNDYPSYPKMKMNFQQMKKLHLHTTTEDLRLMTR